jgi:pimeloyl-ACP methyl ester carboxylesterase
MDVDWTGHFVETPELRVHYVRAGQGEPIVLLHGWPEFARTWLHNLPVLAQHFDVIALEFRGFGRTQQKGPRGAGGIPPQLLARDLKEFADALGLKSFGIVAHDIGSFVAQTFVQSYPDRVTRIFFFNCGYPGIGRRWGASENFPELWYQQFHQKDFAASLVGSSREAMRLYFRHFLTHWTHQKEAFEPYLEEWIDNFSRPGNLQGGFDWYIGVSRFRSRMMREGAIEVPKIAHPAYFLWGRYDPVLKAEYTDQLGEYFSNHQLEFAEEAGHFVHFEEPELANSRIIDFHNGRDPRADR